MLFRSLCARKLGTIRSEVQSVEVTTYDDDEYRIKSHLLFGAPWHFAASCTYGKVRDATQAVDTLKRRYGQDPDWIDGKLAAIFGILINKIHIHMNGPDSMAHFNHNAFRILDEIDSLSSKRQRDVIQKLIAEIDTEELAQDTAQCRSLVRKIIESLKGVGGGDAGPVLGTLLRWINGPSGVQAYNHELAGQLSRTVEDARGTLSPFEYESF